ncbi:MAG: ATP-binding protein [Aureliella sp.]
MTSMLELNACAATLRLPVSGEIDLELQAVSWCSPNGLTDLDARLLYTASFVCDGLERYAFEHLSWSHDQPKLTTILVERVSETQAEFKLGPAKEFEPESIFGFVPASAFDQSSDVYLLSDANPSLHPGPRVVYVNSAFERMTGYDSSEIIGRTPRILQGEETCSESLSRIRDGLAKWLPVNVEVTNYKKDGSKFRVQLDIVPIADSLGWYVYWFSKQIDISEERQAKLERESIARQVGMVETATGVLHNVGNVLNSINTSSRIIQEKLNSNQVLRSLKRSNQLLEEKHEEILQPTKLAENFGSFLDVMTRHAETDFESIDAELKSIESNLDHLKSVIANQQRDAKEGVQYVDRTLVAEVIDQTLNVCKGHLAPGIEIDTHVASPRDSLVVAKHSVVQILSNLIKNASEAVAEAGTEDPRIEFCVYSTDQNFTFEIADNGPGFEPEKASQLFSHGFSTKGRGSGFGLSACAELAERMGGALTGESHGPGTGATFRLVI